MVQRPRIDDDVMERLDEKVDDVIRVAPEKVGEGEKIRILIDELESVEDELEEMESVDERLMNIENSVRNIKNSVRDTGDYQP